MQWNGNCRKIPLDVPCFERGAQPDIVPTPKCTFRVVAMVPLQPVFQIGGMVLLSDRCNTIKTALLDKGMWRFTDNTSEPGRGAAFGMNECNGCTVAVADQDEVVNRKPVAEMVE